MVGLVVGAESVYEIWFSGRLIWNPALSYGLPSHVIGSAVIWVYLVLGCLFMRFVDLYSGHRIFDRFPHYLVIWVIVYYYK